VIIVLIVAACKGMQMGQADRRPNKISPDYLMFWSIKWTVHRLRNTCIMITIKGSNDPRLLEISEHAS